jgi:ATP-dependent helicase/nuclease subunit A
MSLFLSKTSAVVQAGAGSGKTHSLVGLCLHLLGGVGRTAPLLPARLCAVTFTEKAAAELQARLRARLDRLARVDRESPEATSTLEKLEPELWASCNTLSIPFPTREIWQRARRDLDDAEIGTLHGVCMRILRRHAAAAGLDPAFTVLDPLDGQLLFGDACERAILDALEGDGPLRESAERLCAETGLRKGHRFGNGVADDLLRLSAALGESGKSPDELIAASPGLDPARARDAFVEAKRDLSRALEQLDLAARAGKFSATLERARSGLAAFRAQAIPALNAVAPGELSRAWRAIEAAVGELPSRGKSELGQASAAVKDALDELEEADAQVRICVHARDLAGLAAQAIERHRAEKLRRRALEFDDLTQLARELLARDFSVRRAEKERIDALLVDEFQDTSRAQLELCGWLAEDRAGEGSQPPGSGLPGSLPLGRGLLFLVGDRKQSIYEFRGADVAAAQAFADAAVRDGAERHFLRTSYRSLPKLVEFANQLFLRTLPDAGKDGVRQPFHAPFILGEDDLRAARSGSDLAAAELLTVEGDLDDESTAVARRIAAMLAPGAKERVRDKDPLGHETERPVRGGDIAILMRSFLPVEALRRALLRARIPHVIVGGRLFHEAREVLDLRALLALILDRDDAPALAAVLRSPFGPVSDDGLALLARGQRRDREGALQPGRGLTRHALEDAELLATLDADDQEVVARLSRLIARLQGEVDRLGPSALLEAALEETRYRAAIAGGLFGEQAAANVERLLEMARSLELETARPAGALRGLLGRLEALDAMGGGEAEAAVVEEKSPHAVRLLTIHAAKGLEFPIVFVPLTAMFPPPGAGLLVDPDLGLALRLKGPSGETRWGKPGAAVRDRRDAREQAQSRRLLYVAATRARDRVIFSGRTAERKESTPSWWSLLLEAAAVGAISPLIDRVDAKALPPPRRDLEPALLNHLDELDVLAAQPAPVASARSAAQGIPAQISRAITRSHEANPGTLIAPVTQLANAALCPRRYQLLHELGLEERPSERAPAAAIRSDELDDDPPLDAAERGTLVHGLLERLPLDPALSMAELRARASRLLDDEQVEASAQPALIDAALGFLTSETGRRLREAPERRRMRELPFALQLSPSADEPPGPKLLLRGQIDLLLLDGDHATVLDYKLSESRDPEVYALQLGAYALAAHELTSGSVPVQTGLVFLKSRGAPTVLRDPSTASDREQTRKTLLDAARTIAQGRAQSHFAKIEVAGCRAIGCGFLRRCHGEERST